MALVHVQTAPDAALLGEQAAPEDLQPAEPPPSAEQAAPPSAGQPDWTREACSRWEWHPSRQLMRALRDYQRERGQTRLLSPLRRRWAVLRHRFWSSITGADIPLNSHIDGGLMLPHPDGVVVHPDARIGPNCLLFQQVTIGTGPKPGLPQLGGHVDVGPGAKILGGVHIGDHAVIGANAVVLSDVPARSVAVGVPATARSASST